jgi:hypothetical protein
LILITLLLEAPATTDAASFVSTSVSGSATC